MNLTPLAALFIATFASLGTACGGESGSGSEEDPSSSSQESLVSSGDPAPSTGGECVQRVLCTKDTHWDRKSCACVADPGPGSGRCVQTKACAIDAHWDRRACACVPNIECLKAPCP